MRQRQTLSKIFLSLTIPAVLLSAHLSPTAAQDRPQKSLYERLGGVMAISAVVDDFVNRLFVNPTVTGNPKVAEAAKHITVPGLKYLVTEQLCAATGGPHNYTGRDMKGSHRHLGVSEEEWKAAAGDLKATLDKFNVPDREQQEVFTLIGSTKKDIVAAQGAHSDSMKEEPHKMGRKGSLYSRLGGIYPISSVVDDFVNRLLMNPTVTGNPKVVEAMSHITVPGLKFLLTEQIGAASGGPQKYTGRSMK